MIKTSIIIFSIRIIFVDDMTSTKYKYNSTHNIDVFPDDLMEDEKF